MPTSLAHNPPSAPDLATVLAPLSGSAQSALCPRLDIAVVGVGRWGEKICHALAHVEGVRLAAVCDVKLAGPRQSRPALPGRARTGGGALDAPEPFGSMAELLARSDVDAIVVATPPDSHAQLARRALAAGKHVLVEKPMALSVHEARGVYDAARRSGRTLMVGHVVNYHLGVERVAELVRGGELGHLRAMWCERFAPRAGAPDAWWNLAPHDVSLCQRFFAAQPLASQRLARPFEGEGAEAAATATSEALVRLEFSGSCWAHVHVSHRLQLPRRSRVVWCGSHHTLSLEEGAAGSRLAIGPALARSELESYWAAWSLGQYAIAGVPEPPPQVELGDVAAAVPTDTPLVRELQHFVASIRRDRPALTDAAEGLAVVRTLVAAATSREKRWARGT